MNVTQAPMTAPFPVTKMDKPIYYACNIPQASMHREDGKRIPFHAGFFRADLEEDKNYLDREIKNGNPHIRRCNAEEAQQAKMLEDPLGTIRETVKAEVMENLTTDALEKLLAEKKAKAAPPAGSRLDPRVLAARAAAMARAATPAPISPASTADLETGAESNG